MALELLRLLHHNHFQVLAAAHKATINSGVQVFILMGSYLGCVQTNAIAGHVPRVFYFHKKLSTFSFAPRDSGEVGAFTCNTRKETPYHGSHILLCFCTKSHGAAQTGLNFMVTFLPHLRAAPCLATMRPEAWLTSLALMAFL